MRVLRANHSPEALRATGRVQLILGISALVLAVPLVAAVVSMWEACFELGWVGRRGPFFITLAATAVVGYGIVAVTRGVRMLRQARRTPGA